MKVSARFNSVLDIIDHLTARPTLPADQAITSYFRGKRYIGAADRRHISEILYTMIRHRGLLDWMVAQISGETTGEAGYRLLLLAYLVWENRETPEEVFTGEAYSLQPLNEREIKALKALRALDLSAAPDWVQHHTPAWLYELLLAQFGEQTPELLAALNTAASLDLRVNTLKTTRGKVLSILAKEGIPAEPTPYAPHGIRLAHRRPLGDHFLWRDGWIEVQDEGSQLMAFLCDVTPGMAVLDFCAGAGGKTLALAAAMENKGRLVACDVAGWRLERSRERLRRAGVHNAETRVLDDAKWLKRHAEKFDRVLVDAPCSGVGTWRRNPDIKWKSTPEQLRDLCQQQADILDQAALLVKAEGWLIYGTCSLLQQENDEQAAAFLHRHPDFEPVCVSSIWEKIHKGQQPFQGEIVTLLPHLTQTDGFFISVFRKK